MKRTAFLIITSRGGVVDEPALYRAFSERRAIAAYVLASTALARCTSLAVASTTLALPL